MEVGGCNETTLGVGNATIENEASASFLVGGTSKTRGVELMTIRDNMFL